MGWLDEAWEYASWLYRRNPQPWWLHLLLYEGLLVGVWALERLLSRRIRRETGDPIRAEEHDRGYRYRLLLQFLLLQAPLIRLGRWWTPMPRGWEIALGGTAIVLAGVLIRLRALQTLGAHFTYAVAVGEEHALVTSGPYRFVRHPLYSGLLVLLTGLGIVLCDLWLTLGFFLYGAIFVSVRIWLEERALRRRFGAEFEEWRRRTKLLIPGLL